MRLIAKQNGYEIWAQFDQSAQVYELFFDREGESFTGWNVDSLKDAAVAEATGVFSSLPKFIQNASKISELTPVYGIL